MDNLPEWAVEAASTFISKAVGCDDEEVHFHLAALLAETAERQAGWVSVEERLPELERVVLIVDDTGDGISSALRGAARDNDLGWAWWTHDGTYLHPINAGITHWMDAPPAPPPTEQPKGD